jgi:hypothetical protein
MHAAGQAAHSLLLLALFTQFANSIMEAALQPSESEVFTRQKLGR